MALDIKHHFNSSVCVHNLLTKTSCLKCVLNIFLFSMHKRRIAWIQSCVVRREEALGPQDESPTGRWYAATADFYVNAHERAIKRRQRVCADWLYSSAMCALTYLNYEAKSIKINQQSQFKTRSRFKPLSHPTSIPAWASCIRSWGHGELGRLNTDQDDADVRDPYEAARALKLLEQRVWKFLLLCCFVPVIFVAPILVCFMWVAFAWILFSSCCFLFSCVMWGRLALAMFQRWDDKQRPKRGMLRKSKRKLYLFCSWLLFSFLFVRQLEKCPLAMLLISMQQRCASGQFSKAVEILHALY